MQLGVVLFLSIPEELLITALGLLLFGIGFRKQPGKLLLVAIIQAAISFLVRQFPLPFGIHTIIQIPLFALPLTLLMGLPYLYSLVCILISGTIYTVLDASFVPLLLHLTGIPLEMIMNSTYLRVIFFIPQALTMLLIILLVYYKHFKLFDMKCHRSIRSKKDGRI